MPKLKTRKTARKRFKLTKKGTLMRRQARTSHLRSKESARTKRRKDKTIRVAKADQSKVRKMLGR